MVKGIWESTTGKWSGDVDMNDGQLQQLYQSYHQQLQWYDGIGQSSQATPEIIEQDLRVALQKTDSN